MFRGPASALQLYSSLCSSVPGMARPWGGPGLRINVRPRESICPQGSWISIAH